jgi:hypothetical protein
VCVCVCVCACVCVWCSDCGSTDQSGSELVNTSHIWCQMVASALRLIGYNLKPLATVASLHAPLSFTPSTPIPTRSWPFKLLLHPPPIVHSSTSSTSFGSSSLNHSIYFIYLFFICFFTFFYPFYLW